jgi:hypothetical protein
MQIALPHKASVHSRAVENDRILLIVSRVGSNGYNCVDTRWQFRKPMDFSNNTIII